MDPDPVPVVAVYFVDGIYRTIALTAFAGGFALMGGLYLIDHPFPGQFRQPGRPPARPWS